MEKNLKISTLHLWTNGDPAVGIGGDTAEVSSPGWLLNSDDHDPESFKALLDQFRGEMIKTFSLIWDDKVYALYDFELHEENVPPAAAQG